MSTKVLTLGTGLDTKRPFTIPLARAATKKFGVFGKSGSGKTYAAGVLMEELLEQHVPVVVLDPVGVWYGLGLAADGIGAGYPIAIFGGKHGQVELAPDMGGAIARYVAAMK